MKKTSRMSFIAQIIKSFPMTLCCILLIWLLCFCTPPSTGLNQVVGIDKLVHIAMYLGTGGIFWMEFLRSKLFCRETTTKTFYRKIAFFSFLAFTSMSAIIELLQEFATNHRGGEWMDLISNAFGAALASIFGAFIAINKYAIKK